MIKEFADFSEDDLLFIAQCKKLKYLGNRFNDHQIQSLIYGSNIHIKKQGNYLKPHNESLDQAFLSVGEMLSNPIYVLYYLSGIFTAVTFSIICIVFIPISLVVSSIYFYSTYQEERKKANRLENNFQFIALKLSAANELLELQGKSSPNFPEQSIDLIMEKVNSNGLIRLRRSMTTGMGMASTLFGSYYSVAFVLGACGSSLSIGLLGPLAMVAAVVFSIGVGAYFGYKYYQSERNDRLLKKSQKKMTEDLEDKLGEHAEIVKSKEKSRKPTHKNIQFFIRKNVLNSHHGTSISKAAFFKKTRSHSALCSKKDFKEQESENSFNA